ncbi:hypothetical protein RCO28_18185 [Streptomyces sp. LHD-70]|uniref:hypothetical protein n=1 Tax=Streptomyces sp. LHD-70 TaxID=3072140 RepID=UPI00280C990C|nr:hypothetical protein [Streptomyces sp. LHD-70]MDQ8704403.1 hypothetical protein [Streptomyces sp. LHD-70]
MNVHLQEEPVISAIRKTLIATGCAAVVLTGATACDPIENASAAHQVDDAVEQLGEQRSLTLEFGLDADAATLEKLIQDSEDAKSGGGDGPPPGFGAFLSKARVQMSLRAEKPLADAEEKDLSGTSMRITGADGTLVEYRALGEDRYYRADLAAFGKLADTPIPSAADLPEEAGALRSVLQGKWVKVDPKMLPGPARNEPALDEKTQAKLLKGIRQVLAREVRFKENGDSDGTSRITAKANARSLLTRLAEKLEPMASDLPPGTELPTAEDFKSVPKKQVKVHFVLKDGKLRKITFDLAQLADKSDGLEKGAKLPLTMKFGKAPKIERPAKATELTMSDLMFIAGSQPAMR